MAGPTPPGSPEASPRKTNASSLPSTQGHPTEVPKGHQFGSVGDLHKPLQLLLQQLREEVDVSFQKYELGVQSFWEEARVGQSQLLVSARDDSAREPVATCPMPQVYFPTNHGIQDQGLDEPSPPEIRPSMRPKIPAGDTAQVTSEVVAEKKGSRGESGHATSVYRLKQQKGMAPGSTHVDSLIQTLACKKPKVRFRAMVANFKFRARPLVSQDSQIRHCTGSTAYRFLRAAAVVLDALLVVIELQRGALLVVDSRDATEVPSFAWALSICCAFFWFDLIIALILEFPSFDILLGRTGYRYLNVLATIQLTLGLVGAFTARDQRFTSPFRKFVGHFIFLRIVRPMVVLPELGGAQLHQTLGELHVMIRALTGTLQPLLWCTLMCFIILLIFSVFFAEAAAAHLVRVPPALPESSDAVLAQTWGTVSRSVFSLFTATFGGQDWADLYDALDPLTLTPKIFFCGFICFTYIALLNTVTAVFIKCAFMRLEQDREFMVRQELEEKRDYLHTLHHIFDQLDQDSSGIVAFAELEESLKDPEVSAYFNRLGVDTDEMEKLFILMDQDGSGTITLEEFMMGCLRLKGEAKSLDLEILHSDVKFVIGTVMENRAQLERLIVDLDDIGQGLKTSSPTKSS